MDKFKFNFDLLACLPSVFGLTVTEIARRCKINQPTLRLYVVHERIIPVQTVIAICNTLRMPTHHFFYEGDTSAIPEREQATIELSRWKPVQWNEEAVEHIFGDAPRHIWWKKVAAAMGTSEQKPRGRFALRTRFPVTDFLRVCNAFNLSPYTFLIDHNPLPGDEYKTKLGKRRTVTPPAKDTDPLLADIANLRKNIADLNATVEDLTAKYEALLKSHEALAKRVSVNIENINNSSVNIATDGHK